MIGDKVTLIIAIILGIAVGFGIGFLSKALIDKIEIAELEKERDSALLQKNTMQEKWELATQELSQTKVLLQDTFAALELLKQYQVIDNDTKDKIKDIDNTLDPEGKPTEDTYDKLRNLIEDYNKKNKVYNTASVMLQFGEINLMSFVEIRKEAEKLFKEVSDLLLEVKGE